ncbi:MAG TPA: undecaprenyldiphospho-muramoylpentapeptide beta-N-acetylglucosaminyltransferase [Candidatus Binataceae bacterium]|nr:undecaprenyldiphospho-muramoylpentapeptide beta-N-acetylglucosaminyltransferase [Candidatus Binataceae bacterium]
MKVIIAGGGTGGHLFPAVAVGEAMMRERPQTEVLFVGTTAGLEARWMPHSGLRYELFQVHGIRGHNLVERLRAVGEFVAALRRARGLLGAFGADLVVGAGGYASAPMAMAAIMARIPLVLMEENTRPGLSNRMLWRFATKVCVGFEEAVLSFNSLKVVVSGNPVRFNIEPSPLQLHDPLQILVLGGSTGAHRLNEGVINALRNLRESVIKVTLVHQTGEADVGLVKGGYAALGCQAHVVPFIDDMATALARADLLVARAGAMTVSEVALAGRPAVFVPYPFHRDRQQELNARVLERRGAAVIVADDERLGENLAATLRELIHDPERLVRMAALARTAAKPEAARTIAQLCFELGARERAVA